MGLDVVPGPARISTPIRKGDRTIRSFVYRFLVVAAIGITCGISHGVQSTMSLEITFSEAPTLASVYAVALLGGSFQGDYFDDPSAGEGDPGDTWQVSYPISGSGSDSEVGSPNADAAASAGGGGVSAGSYAVVSGNLFGTFTTSGIAIERFSQKVWASNGALTYTADEFLFVVSGASAGGLLLFDQSITIEDIDFSFDYEVNIENSTTSYENPTTTVTIIALDPATYISISAGGETILSGSYGLNKSGVMIATGDFSVVDDEYVFLDDFDPITLPAGEYEFTQDAVSRMPGDYNDDQDQNADDIDALAAAILANQSADPDEGEVFDLLDLTTDDSIDASDMDFLIHTLLETEYGDADLDGDVDGDDYVLALVNFDTTGGWADGDFDGDGQINGNDLVIAQTFGSGFSWADFNYDTYVDGADFSAFLGYWTSEYDPVGGPGDFNWDGEVDGADYSFFLGEWTGGPLGLGIPEPASAALLALGSMMLISRRRS